MAPIPRYAGNTPSEFGGIPGLFDNADAVRVFEETSKVEMPYDQAEPLAPRLTRTALTQTDTTDPASSPAYGDGGMRVQ